MADKYEHVRSNTTPQLGNAFTKWIARTTLDLMGWTITGSFPKDEPKLVFIGAPHTSNWDFILALASMQAGGIKASWMMKKEAFFWPLGGLFKKMGGIPIDRNAKTDLTTQMADWFASVDQGYLGITPEGTRAKVDDFKKGYLRIAYAANVPVFTVGIHAPRKEIILDKIMPLTLDIEVDNREIKAYYDRTFEGIKPENG